MRKYLKIALFGFFVWLIPFVVSVPIFPLKESNRALFESIMPVIGTLSTVFFLIVYFRKIQAGFLKEGILVGIIWLAISLILDLLLFMEGPMKMSFPEYMADIGLVYLAIPTISIGLGYLLEIKNR